MFFRYNIFTVIIFKKTNLLLYRIIEDNHVVRILQNKGGS